MRDFEMSVWDSIKDTRFNENRRVITITELFDVIKSNEYKVIIDRIRAEPDADKRKGLKEMLPAVTISGIFNERKNQGLLRHSKFICMDFDKLGNQKQSYKDKLKEDKFVYGFFTSASGNGLAVVVKIDPLRHQETFDALSKYFHTQYGLVADIGCKEVARLRFFSYDPDAHLNFQASAYDKFVVDKQPKKHYVYVPSTNTDISKVVNQGMQRRCDITDGSYGEWMRLAASIATLGEFGRPFFHVLSQFSPKYNPSQCDRMFTNMLHGSNGSITIGTFFYFCKRAGLEINTEKAKRISSICRELKARKDGTADAAIKKLKAQNIICTDDDETSKEEDVELVKKVYDTIEANTPCEFTEIKDYIIDNYQISYNEITDENEWAEDGKVFSGDDYSRVYLEVKEQFEKVKKSDVIDIVRTNTPRHNPLKQFIEENRHLIDAGKTHGMIKELSKTIVSDTALNEECFDADYEEYFITKWFIGMIASMYGNVSPLLLALTGKQATGKTWWFRHLLPGKIMKYYAEIKLSTDKDAYAAMTKNLLIMDDELTGKTKMEEQHLKEITSKAVFTYRPPYGITHIHRKRLAVLAGTTNDEKVLSDPTGNRRIIPINVLEIKQDKYNSIDKTLLFMEAARLYESGQAWELTRDDIKRLNNVTVQHIADNLERDLVLMFFAKPENDAERSFAKFMTTTDILLVLVKETEQNLKIKKVGMELRMLGFERTTKRINGIVTSGYHVLPKKTTCF